MTDEFNKFLDQKGWEIEDLAYVLNIDDKELLKFYLGKKKITAKLSIMLGEAFKISGSHFLDLQVTDNLSKSVSKSAEHIKIRGYWMNILPIRDMIDRQWIEGQDITSEILKFFDVFSIEELPFETGIDLK